MPENDTDIDDHKRIETLEAQTLSLAREVMSLSTALAALQINVLAGRVPIFDPKSGESIEEFAERCDADHG